MPNYGPIEQANVDRFVKSALHRFRYVPAWGLWFEGRADVWDVAGVEAELRSEYLERLRQDDAHESSGDKSEKWLGEGATAQKNAMWLLQNDPRMLAYPLEFERPGGRALRWPFPEWTQDLEDSLHHLAGALFPGEMAVRVSNWAVAARGWDSHAHAGAGEHFPNVLLRADSNLPELGSLVPLLERLFGDRVTRIPARTWAEFPESLGPALALRLMGRRVVVLEGPTDRRSERFPWVPLYRWASGGEWVWSGRDGSENRVTLPSHVVVTGAPLVNRDIETELRRHLCWLGGVR